MTQPRLRDLADLTEVVRELTTAREHRQSYRAGWTRANRTGPVVRDHITLQPSLLNQLRACIPDRAGAGIGRAGRIAHTVLPRFSEDAHDRLEKIRQEITDWTVMLGAITGSTWHAGRAVIFLDNIRSSHAKGIGLTPPVAAALEVVRASVADIRDAMELDLRAIMDVAPRAEPDVVHDLACDAERWRTWCRIIAGWETPALRPHVPCPNCGVIAGERAGLRIRIDGASGTGGIVDDAGVRAAMCLSCNRTWDAATVGVLAEELRDAGEVLDEVA